jgi:sulfate/thiosulfate transport system substrate-binding protein
VGADVRVGIAYGDTGAEIRRLVRRRSPDLVIPATAADMDALVRAGAVPRAWIQPYGDNVADTLVVFIRRSTDRGEGIRSWRHLAAGGVEVVVPDPRTSDVGRWTALAAYGAGRGPAFSDHLGRQMLRGVFDDALVEAGPDDALAAFQSGAGDVLLGYESDAIAALRKGMEVDYAIPADTIVVEYPIAVTRRGGRDARALAAFLGTERAQRLIAKSGFRPAVSAFLAEGASYPHDPREVFTISTAGGWEFATSELFSEGGLVARLLP